MAKKEISSKRDFVVALSLFLFGTVIMLYVVFSILSFVNTTLLPQAGALH